MKLILDPILVLSFLPYGPCGATVGLLALDLFGRDGPRECEAVDAALHTLRSRPFPVTRKSLSATGDGVTGHLHYWLDFSKCPAVCGEVEELVRPHLGIFRKEEIT